MGFNPRDAGIFLGMPLIKHAGQCLLMNTFASAKATTIVTLFPKVALYLMAIVKIKLRCSCSQSMVPACRPWLFSILWASLSSMMLLGLARVMLGGSGRPGCHSARATALCSSGSVHQCVHRGVVEKRKCMKITVLDQTVNWISRQP